MAEYIKREDAFDVACAECEDGTFYDIPSKIMGIPSADVVERKRGRWNWVGFNIECSECGAMPNFDSTEPLYNFCPNCGARMESEGEDEEEM